MNLLPALRAVLRAVPELAVSLLESGVAPVYACEGEAYRYMVAVETASKTVIGWSIRPESNL